MIIDFVPAQLLAIALDFGRAIDDHQLDSSDGGKITPARISKLSIAQQKQVSAAVKKARNLALLPSGTDAYDTAPRPELISPVPFEA